MTDQTIDERIAKIEALLAAQSAPAPSILSRLVPSVMQQLMASKKAVAMATGLLILGGNKLGVHVDQASADRALALIGVYILGQSFHDAAKEKAKAI